MVFFDRDMSGFLKQVTKILGIQWELRGADELAVERGCIIVSNHQSALDVLGRYSPTGQLLKPF